MAKKMTSALGIPPEKWIEALAPQMPRSFDRLSPARQRLERFIYENGGSGAFSGAGWVAEKLGIPRKRLLEATKGQPFRRDFGHDRRGPVAVFFDDGLLQWALGGGRQPRAHRDVRLKAVA